VIPVADGLAGRFDSPASLVAILAVGLLAMSAAAQTDTPAATAAPTETPTPAAVYVVNSTADGADFAVDGVCETASGNRVCTLRAAIGEADATAALDSIAFAIDSGTDSGCDAGTGVCTIALGSALPTISHPVVIDGTTQKGTVCPDGAAAWKVVVDVNGGPLGIKIDGGAPSLIQGLEIRNSRGEYPIEIASGDGNTIRCNYLHDSHVGIGVFSNSNVVGGSGAGDGNVLSGNSDNAVDVFGNDNLVRGNLIGTDPTGLSAEPNGIGVIVSSNYSDCEGNLLSGNVISGNSLYGVVLVDWSAINSFVNRGNRVEGNTIGRAKDGGPLGNGYGVGFLGPARDNTIGGTVRGAGNVIANSINAGITTFDPIAKGTFGNVGAGNALLGNSIYADGGLGIDLAGPLGPEGVTANDPGDADAGPNGLQNFPALTAARTDGVASTIVTGTLDSAASSDYRIEFFASPTGNTSGNGEGETFLGATSVSTDAAGHVGFTATDLAPTTVGYAIAATASKREGNGHFSTSEFSPYIAAETVSTATPTVTPTATPTSDSSTPTRGPAQPPCGGDCNGDGLVTIDELILGVNIALGLEPADGCPGFANPQGVVDIAQLVRGVNDALNGCSRTVGPGQSRRVVVPGEDLMDAPAG
jgi:hypothetical protein